MSEKEREIENMREWECEGKSKFEWLSEWDWVSEKENERKREREFERGERGESVWEREKKESVLFLSTKTLETQFNPYYIIDLP